MIYLVFSYKMLEHHKYQPPLMHETYGQLFTAEDCHYITWLPTGELLA